MYLGIKKHIIQKSERVYVAGTYGSIISWELFDKVQELIEDRKQKCLASKDKYSNLEK